MTLNMRSTGKWYSNAKELSSVVHINLQTSKQKYNRTYDFILSINSFIYRLLLRCSVLFLSTQSIWNTSYV